jgi:hypothetical protein
MGKLCRKHFLVVVAEEEDDAIYTIFFNKKRAHRGGAHYVCYDRLVVEVFLELNEGKRERHCLSMSPMQTASGVLQHFHLDKASHKVIIDGAAAHFVLDIELGSFEKDVGGVLQMMIKCKPCVGNLSAFSTWCGVVQLNNISPGLSRGLSGNECVARVQLARTQDTRSIHKQNTMGWYGLWFSSWGG